MRLRHFVWSALGLASGVTIALSDEITISGWSVIAVWDGGESYLGPFYQQLFYELEGYDSSTNNIFSHL